MLTAEEIISVLNLKPHTEGGYYRQTYLSKLIIPLAQQHEKRPSSSSVYYLLRSNEFSAFHRLKSDEMWHYYLGSPLTLHTLHPASEHKTQILGPDLFKSQQPQILIPANTWFAAKVIHPNTYTLCGCTVTPGFDYADFELANRNELLTMYPQYKELIIAHTR
jgi:predicted cupin superfamily sugar epimerase